MSFIKKKYILYILLITVVIVVLIAITYYLFIKHNKETINTSTTTEISTTQQNSEESTKTTNTMTESSKSENANLSSSGNKDIQKFYQENSNIFYGKDTKYQIGFLKDKNTKFLFVLNKNSYYTEYTIKFKNSSGDVIGTNSTKVAAGQIGIMPVTLPDGYNMGNVSFTMIDSTNPAIESYEANSTYTINDSKLTGTVSYNKTFIGDISVVFIKDHEVSDTKNINIQNQTKSYDYSIDLSSYSYDSIYVLTNTYSAN